MSRRITSFLLAGVAAASLPVAQPANALLEPIWDCGFVAVRDLVFGSSNTWIAAEYAYAVGIPTVHTNVRVTCWAQHTEPNLGTPSATTDSFPGTGVAGLYITCTAAALPNACTNAPTTYVNPPGTGIYFCWHVVWDDTVTGVTNFTRRSDPCQRILQTLGNTVAGATAFVGQLD